MTGLACAGFNPIVRGPLMSEDNRPVISDRDKRTTLLALLTVFLLAALDMSILSTAMPRIVAELDGLELYAWVTTAYMLTSTVLVPIYGKLGDQYGRKPVLLLGIAIFLIGSALCGISGEFGTLPLLGDGMMQLIVFRAVKGIGGAALFTSAIGMIADIFPPLQRARFMGLFGAIFGLASIIGPALGGFLTDFATVTLFGYEIAGWRWVFYVNIPLGLLAMAVIAWKTPKLNHGTGGRIDVVGAVLLMIVFVPFLLALTWGGNRYAWGSTELLSMFAVSAVALVLFIVIEKRTPDAIMPMTLFSNKVFVMTNLSSFVVGMAFMGVVMFMPLFMQVVLGVNAINSGFSMFPMMAGLMLGSISSGRLVARHGRYKPFMVGGVAVLLVGVFLLTGVGPDTSLMDLNLRMFVVGIGLGPSQSLVNLVVQSAFPMSQIGVATSSTQFFRQIGNTIGVAIFGTLLILNLKTELPAQLPTLAAMTGGMTLDPSQAQNLVMNSDRLAERLASIPGIDVASTMERLTSGVRMAFSNSITAMFSFCLWIILAGMVVTLFIPVIPLQSHGKAPTAEKK